MTCFYKQTQPITMTVDWPTRQNVDTFHILNDYLEFSKKSDFLYYTTNLIKIKCFS